MNFKSVAETAGVSMPFLYQTQTLRERITHLRTQSAPVVQLKPKNYSFDTLTEEKIENLRLRIKELETENHTLKHQLGVVFGQLLQDGQLNEFLRRQQPSFRGGSSVSQQ